MDELTRMVTLRLTDSWMCLTVIKMRVYGWQVVVECVSWVNWRGWKWRGVEWKMMIGMCFARLIIISELLFLIWIIAWLKSNIWLLFCVCVTCLRKEVKGLLSSRKVDSKWFMGIKVKHFWIKRNLWFGCVWLVKKWYSCWTVHNDWGVFDLWRSDRDVGQYTMIGACLTCEKSGCVWLVKNKGVFDFWRIGVCLTCEELGRVWLVEK